MKDIWLNNKNFVLRRFDFENDSIEELTDLLHRAYKFLSDIGLRFTATHQDTGETKSRAENGYCFVITADNELIATITIYFNKHTNPCSWYRNEGVCYFGQFAVDPDHQKIGIGSYLMNFVEDFARENGASEIALDTSEKAAHLIRYYEKRGYRFIQYHQWEAVNYRSVVMSRKL